MPCLRKTRKSNTKDTTRLENRVKKRRSKSYLKKLSKTTKASKKDVLQNLASTAKSKETDENKNKLSCPKVLLPKVGVEFFMYNDYMVVERKINKLQGALMNKVNPNKKGVKVEVCVDLEKEINSSYSTRVLRQRKNKENVLLPKSRAKNKKKLSPEVDFEEVKEERSVVKTDECGLEVKDNKSLLIKNPLFNNKVITIVSENEQKLVLQRLLGKVIKIPDVDIRKDIDVVPKREEINVSQDENASGTNYSDNSKIKNEVGVDKVDKKAKNKRVALKEITETSMITRTQARKLAEQIALNYSLKPELNPKKPKKNTKKNKIGSTKTKTPRISKKTVEKKSVKAHTRKRKTEKTEIKQNNETSFKFREEALVTNIRNSELIVDVKKSMNGTVPSPDKIEPLYVTIDETFPTEDKSSINFNDEQGVAGSSSFNMIYESDDEASKPIYMRVKAPLLPTYDCFDSDEENFPTTRKEKPAWLTREKVHEAIKTNSFINASYRNTLFSLGPQTPNLQEIFVAIDPKKLSRNSSAIWSSKPRYTTVPGTKNAYQ